MGRCVITKEILQQEHALPAMRLNTVARSIHQTILVIDAELGVAVDTQYRQRLVKAAYALRTLEELILLKPADCSRNSGLGQRRNTLAAPKEKTPVTV